MFLSGVERHSNLLTLYAITAASLFSTENIADLNFSQVEPSAWRSNLTRMTRLDFPDPVSAIIAILYFSDEGEEERETNCLNSTTSFVILKSMEIIQVRRE
jgi:hypothetical protein